MKGLLSSFKAFFLAVLSLLFSFLLCLFFSQLAFVSWLKLENLFKNLILLYLKQEDKPSIL
ncbi:MAG: hypothetical protein CH104c_0409 [Candidatus Woesebacteria bacterium]|nr:MAG: hypothetical protein CH104c_0409 [Candidatus Woesebacteria bacterium]